MAALLPNSRFVVFVLFLWLGHGYSLLSYAQQFSGTATYTNDLTSYTLCDGENGQGTMDTIVNDYVRRGGADCAEYCEVTCHNIYENQNICASNEHSVSVVVKIVGFSPQSNGVNFFLTQSAFYSIAQPDYGTISVVSEETS